MNSNYNSKNPPLFDEANATANAAREKAVYLYFRALERGHNEVMARILKQAENDAQLEAMIWEGHQLELAERDLSEQTEASKTLVGALEEAFPGKVLQSPEPVFQAPPPLTLADVAARLQTEESAQGTLISAPADRNALSQLSQMREQGLPPRLTPRHLKKLFAQLGLQTTQRFQEQFKEAAVFLSMGRGHSAHLAATRSARSRQKKEPEASAPGSIEETE